jgi:hypothetical protein
VASKYRIFIAFAIEDVTLRDFLVGQGRSHRTPFSFVDMSAKRAWKTNCRTKIRGCDAVIGIITSNTPSASGQIWELNCAYDEGLPVLLMYGYPDDRPARLPDPVKGRRILTWGWDNIAGFLDRL